MYCIWQWVTNFLFGDWWRFTYLRKICCYDSSDDDGNEIMSVRIIPSVDQLRLNLSSGQKEGDGRTVDDESILLLLFRIESATCRPSSTHQFQLQKSKPLSSSSVLTLLTANRVFSFKHQNIRWLTDDWQLHSLLRGGVSGGADGSKHWQTVLHEVGRKLGPKKSESKSLGFWMFLSYYTQFHGRRLGAELGGRREIQGPNFQMTFFKQQISILTPKFVF